MSRALISYASRNWVDDPATTVEFDTGDYTPVDGFPLSNLLVRQSSSVARWTNIGVAGFVALHVTFAQPKPVAVVGLLGCNFRAANHVASLQVNALVGGDWIEPIAVMDNQDNGVRSLPYNLIAPLPIGADGSRPMVSELRIVAEWDAAGADYSEAARLWAGDAIVLLDGFDAGWEMQAVETGMVSVSKGQQAYEDPNVRPRQINGPLDGISTSTAWGFDEDDTEAADVPSINDLQLAAGATGEVLVICRTRTPVWVRRSALYGRLLAVPRIVHKSGPLWTSGVSVIEER